MQNPRLASRYAKSLLDLAVEQNNLEATLKDVQLLDSICRQNRQFTVVLRSPVIPPDKKEAVINAVMGAHIQPLTKAFIHLLVAKGREGVLPEIGTAFIQQYKDMKSIRTVKLTTAAPLNDTVKESIRTKVAASMPDQSIELTTVIDPELIGGFMLEMNDKLIDASVRRDLMDMRKTILDKSYTVQIR